MTSITKLLTTTALAATLASNSYSQNIENVIVAYASPQDKKTKTRFYVDSLKSYNLYFDVEKINFMDYLMKGKKPKEFKSEARLYIVRKTEKEILVIPTTLEGGHDFSKDSKEKIKKEVREFLKDEKVTISDAVEYGSAEMFLELDEEK